jgi:hypothetical protein
MRSKSLARDFVVALLVFMAGAVAAEEGPGPLELYLSVREALSEAVVFNQDEESYSFLRNQLSFSPEERRKRTTQLGPNNLSYFLYTCSKWPIPGVDVTIGSGRGLDLAAVQHIRALAGQSLVEGKDLYDVRVERDGLVLTGTFRFEVLNALRGSGSYRAVLREGKVELGEVRLEPLEDDSSHGIVVFRRNSKGGMMLTPEARALISAL